MMGFFMQKYHFGYLIHLAGNGKMNSAHIDRFMDLILYKNYDFVFEADLKGSSKKITL